MQQLKWCAESHASSPRRRRRYIDCVVSRWKDHSGPGRPRSGIKDSWLLLVSIGVLEFKISKSGGRSRNYSFYLFVVENVNCINSQSSPLLVGYFTYPSIHPSFHPSILPTGNNRISVGQLPFTHSLSHYNGLGLGIWWGEHDDSSERRSWLLAVPLLAKTTNRKHCRDLDLFPRIAIHLAPTLSLLWRERGARQDHSAAVLRHRHSISSQKWKDGRPELRRILWKCGSSHVVTTVWEWKW